MQKKHESLSKGRVATNYVNFSKEKIFKAKGEDSDEGLDLDLADFEIKL